MSRGVRYFSLKCSLSSQAAEGREVRGQLSLGTSADTHSIVLHHVHCNKWTLRCKREEVPFLLLVLFYKQRVVHHHMRLPYQMKSAKMAKKQNHNIRHMPCRYLKHQASAVNLVACSFMTTATKSPVTVVYHSPEAPLSQRVRSLDVLYNQINSKHSLPERGTTSKVSLK